MRPKVIAGVVAVSAFLVATISAMHAAGAGESQLNESFDQRDGLITNEWAYRHKNDKRSHHSDRWLVTSGSLFARDGNGYSGTPDKSTVDATSSRGNNSAVFRMISRSSNFENTRIAVQFTPLTWGRRGAGNDWSGFHVFVRYQSEEELYVASALRSSGTVTIKKKTPGGSSNGGTYETLAETRAPASVMHMKTPHDIVVRAVGDDDVTIDLEIDGLPVLRAVDTSDPIGPGRIGIRADDLEFSIEAIDARPADEQSRR